MANLLPRPGVSDPIHSASPGGVSQIPFWEGEYNPEGVHVWEGGEDFPTGVHLLPSGVLSDSGVQGAFLERPMLRVPFHSDFPEILQYFLSRPTKYFLPKQKGRDRPYL